LQNSGRGVARLLLARAVLATPLEAQSQSSKIRYARMHPPGPAEEQAVPLANGCGIAEQMLEYGQP
jgi:hypothetical protein